MMRELNRLTFISFILLIFLLIIMFFGFRAELTNNQGMFMQLAGVFLIIFGFLAYLETKIKWIEKEKKRN